MNDYSKLTHDIISEYNDADNPGLLRQKIAEAFADVASKAIADEQTRCVGIIQREIDASEGRGLDFEDLVRIKKTILEGVSNGKV